LDHTVVLAGAAYAPTCPRLISAHAMLALVDDDHRRTIRRSSVPVSGTTVLSVGVPRVRSRCADTNVPARPCKVPVTRSTAT
jgi:hypothetical protein